MNLTDLRGLITNETGHALFDLAAGVKPGLAIVELGSYEGKSTAFLAAGAPNNCPVFAVDLWDLPNPRSQHRSAHRHHYDDPAHREQFHNQLRAVGLRDRVTAIQSNTVDAATRYKLGSNPPVGLLYVDADHTETAVRADLRAWIPLLDAVAVVAFDDYGRKRNPGVKIVADSLGLPVELPIPTLAVVRLG